MRHLMRAFSTCSAIALFWSGAAGAQDKKAEPVAQADSPASSSDTVGDIVVTAQKRSERLQNVPIAVTAVNDTQLTALGVQSVADLRIAAPALNTTAASGFLANSIRGVGSLAFSPGGESPIGLYVDGVYIAAPQASELALNNIASVEVLKGPQGTLFGRNATGGLIQVTTSTPTQTTEGKFEVGYGNFDTITGKAYLSGGLAENLAADLSFVGRTRDGIGRNRTNPDFEVGAIHHDISTRSKVVWTPEDATTITAIGSYWDGRDSLAYYVQPPGKLPGFAQPPVPARDLGYDAELNDRDQQDGWTASGALKVQHDLNTVQFSSTTAYRKGVFRLLRDLDYTASDVASLDLTQTDKQFSQEFQAGSIGSSRFKWTAGLFYFFLDSQYNPFVINLNNFPDPVAGFATITVNTKTTAKSYAGYGQASYEIFDRTNVTLGGRYTSEKRTESGSPTLVDIVFPGVPTISIPVASREDTFKRFTYRASLDHRFSPEVLVYASLNTGFKSGGFNIGAPGSAPYRPERLTAYEAGIKSDLLGRKLRVNLSGFYYDYSDIQVQKLTTAGILFFNGAKARIYGLEGEITAVLARDFTLTGGFNWISNKFTDFPVCDQSSRSGGVPLNPNGNCTGNSLPFAAKFSGTIAANYTHRVGNGDLNANANVYYNSGYAFEVDNVLRQERYAKINASLRWKSDAGYTVAVFGNNLTNRRTALLAGTQQSGNTGVGYADPRTYGISVGYEF